MHWVKFNTTYFQNNLEKCPFPYLKGSSHPYRPRAEEKQDLLLRQIDFLSTTECPIRVIDPGNVSFTSETKSPSQSAGPYQFVLCCSCFFLTFPVSSCDLLRK